MVIGFKELTRWLTGWVTGCWVRNEREREQMDLTGKEWTKTDELTGTNKREQMDMPPWLVEPAIINPSMYSPQVNWAKEILSSDYHMSLCKLTVKYELIFL